MKDKPSVPLIYDPELAIRIAGGNAAIAAELLALFIRELPFQEEALRLAFAKKDLAQLREITHKLHGSARYCATPALQAAAWGLERALPHGAPEVIAKAYADVLGEIHCLREIHY